MTKTQLGKLQRELDAYVQYLTEGMGRSERRAAMASYVHGLLLDGERKSIEPMAARLAADEQQAPALRQRLQQCITESKWFSEEILRRVALKLDKKMPGLQVWVVDDTGHAKQGTHSVGVARQYSGTLGKRDNCQVSVSLHAAGEQGSGCVGIRLYLPQSWTEDRARCREAGVPEEITFQTKWQIALDLLDQALGWQLTPRVVLADAGYGNTSAFRDGLAARGLSYLMAVPSNHCVWPPGVQPQAPQPRPGRPGRPRTRYGPPPDQIPLSIEQLACQLPRRAYHKVTWREGSRGPQCAYFAARRIHLAPARNGSKPPGPQLWLLCERPLGHCKPTKFYLSNLPASYSCKQLAALAHLRWRVERDYQDLKTEVGLDHFEGRSWNGFHHHAALCAAAHAFLALRRAHFPPEPNSMDSGPCPARASAAFAL